MKHSYHATFRYEGDEAMPALDSLRKLLRRYFLSHGIKSERDNWYTAITGIEWVDYRMKWWWISVSVGMLVDQEGLYRVAVNQNPNRPRLEILTRLFFRKPDADILQAALLVSDCLSSACGVSDFKWHEAAAFEPRDFSAGCSHPVKVLDESYRAYTQHKP